MPAPADGPHGLLIVDKPAGITSHDVVSRTRRALHTRKVGHAGTLDPMATGVLLLGVGDATRLLHYFVGADKEYIATIRLGQATSTEDAEGEPAGEDAPGVAAGITAVQLQRAMAQLTGAIEQVPSAVSAIKIDGKRAYQRVRDGESVELAARSVEIFEFELIDDLGVTGPATRDLRVRVVCSSGTYIRALARDLGAALGVGAHLTALRRTRVGSFAIADAVELDPQLLPTALMAPADVARAAFAVFDADAQTATDLRHGKQVPLPAPLVDETRPIATFDENGALIGLIASRNGTSKTLMNLPQRSDA